MKRVMACLDRRGRIAPMTRPATKPNGMPTPELTLARQASQALTPGCDPYNTSELRKLEAQALEWDPTIDTTAVRIINVR